MKKIISTNRISKSFILFFILIGCEKDVEIIIPTTESEIIVEGWIDQSKGAKVLLSLSAPFFTTIDSSNLRDYSVTRAKVTLISDSKTEILTLKPNNVFFPPYYYFSSELIGSINKDYEILIEYKSAKITSKTTIPNLVAIDSSWFTLNPNSDTLGLLGIRFSDDPAEKNFYRVLTKRFGKDQRFIATFASVFSDELFNGQTIDLSLNRGNSSLLDIDNDRFYQVGDTVIIRFCSIDKEHYNFWNTLQSQIISSANPFASTNNQIISNINGGGGIWGGYAVWYDTIFIK